MSVLLEHDKQRSVQSHLDELTWRTTLVFASIALLTVAWSFTVDEFLETILTTLKPCVGDCLNVYDPAQWSAVRWLTCLLLGIFSTIPLILFQVLQFSKPGLLASEYRAFNRWLILTTLVLIAEPSFWSRKVCLVSTKLDLSSTNSRIGATIQCSGHVVGSRLLHLGVLGGRCDMERHRHDGGVWRIECTNCRLLAPPPLRCRQPDVDVEYTRTCSIDALATAGHVLDKQ